MDTVATIVKLSLASVDSATQIEDERIFDVRVGEKRQCSVRLGVGPTMQPFPYRYNLHSFLWPVLIGLTAASGIQKELLTVPLFRESHSVERYRAVGGALGLSE